MKTLFIFFALPFLLTVFTSCSDDSFYGSAAGGGGTGPSSINFHDLKAFSQGTQVGGRIQVLYRPTQTQYGIVWDEVQLIPGGFMCGWIEEPLYFEDASEASALNMTLQHASARVFTSVVSDLYARKSLDSWMKNITVYNNHQIVIAGCRCNDIPCWQSDGALNGFFKEAPAEEELHDTPPPPTK